MHLDDLLYRPLYNIFGTGAVIRCLYGASFTLQVIDRTSGVEVTEGSGIDVKTIRPAAVLRMRELAELGLMPTDLDGAALDLNGKLWRVKATMPKPAPTGEADGELYLFLMEDEA